MTVQFSGDCIDWLRHCPELSSPALLSEHITLVMGSAGCNYLLLALIALFRTTGKLTENSVIITV